MKLQGKRVFVDEIPHDRGISKSWERIKVCLMGGKGDFPLDK